MNLAREKQHTITKLGTKKIEEFEDEEEFAEPRILDNQLSNKEIIMFLTN